MRLSPDPGAGDTPGETTHTDSWQLTAADLRASLTVIFGRSQLLQRHIHDGQIWDAAGCLETLVAIDEAVRLMDTRLREVEAEQR
jgi:hypothetical protein